MANNISLLDRYDPGSDANFNYGQNVGQTSRNLATGLLGIRKGIKDDAQAKDSKAKIDQFIQEYNSKTGVFAGLDAQQAADKIARLLLPLDKELADKYLAAAQQLRSALMAKSDKEAERQKDLDIANKRIDRDAQKEIDKAIEDNKKYTPGSNEWADKMNTNMFNLSRMMALDVYSQPEKAAMKDQIEVIKKALAETPYGRSLLGIPGAPPPLAVNPDAPTTTVVPGDKKGDEDPAAMANALEDELVALVAGMTPDKLGYYSVTDKGKVSKKLAEISKKLGKDHPTVGTTQSYWVEIQTDARNKARDQEERNKQFRSEQRTLFKDMAAVGGMLGAVRDLRKDPTNVAAKANALTSVLRKESGAAIAESEFLRRMSTWLSADDYGKLFNEMTGAGIIVQGRISKDWQESTLTRITNKYLERVDSKQIEQFAKDITDVPIWEAWWKVGGGKTDKAEPASANKPVAGVPVQKTASGKRYQVINGKRVYLD
jgi:hypothetical protein